MMDFEIRGYPLLALLALLAVAQLVEPMRSSHPGDPESAPPVGQSPLPATRGANDRAQESTRPWDDVDRERGVALLLLLEDAADRWHVR